MKAEQMTSESDDMRKQADKSAQWLMAAIIMSGLTMRYGSRACGLVADKTTAQQAWQAYICLNYYTSFVVLAKL